MTNAAHFTGRNDLLSFINDLLDLKLTKIEEMATGAVACQVIDLIVPNSIPMWKVN
jgi:RP/EB family microtubule-associated protein